MLTLLLEGEDYRRVEADTFSKRIHEYTAIRRQAIARARKARKAKQDDQSSKV